MKLWFRIHGYEASSWAYVYDNLKAGFEADGDEVCIFYDEPANPEEYVELFWGDPQWWQWSNDPVRARIAIALSEARSILQQGRLMVISNLNKADRIICPSVAATQAFIEAPIDVPMDVVNFGVDTDEFSYVDRDWSSELKFFHGGVTQFRKGSWLVPEAFIKAFNTTDAASLTIATRKASPMFLQLKKEYGGHDNITFIDKLEDSMMGLYEDHHIYVSPHLSEGFGLMVPEAMSTGMACLVSRCSAPREYFSNQYGWWVEMSEGYAPVFDCLPDTAGFWRLPSVDSLAKVMREAYADRRECKECGDRGSAFISQSFTWEQTVKGIKQIIQEVLSEKGIGDTAGVQRGSAASVGVEEYRSVCG